MDGQGKLSSQSLTELRLNIFWRTDPFQEGGLASLTVKRGQTSFKLSKKEIRVSVVCTCDKAVPSVVLVGQAQILQSASWRAAGLKGIPKI